MSMLYNYCGNTRDFGGIRNQENKIIVPNKIIRSNIPLNENLKKFLKLNNIKIIIDFRTEEEYRNKPSIFEKDKQFSLYHLLLPNGAVIPESKELVPISYIEMLQAKDSINKLFNLLEKEDGIFYFCSAGKDRTGVISMLILMLLKVDKETIKEDYLKTTEYITQFLDKNEELKKVARIIVPDEVYVDKFFDYFFEKYKSIEQYLNDIGIEDISIENIRKKYLLN